MKITPAKMGKFSPKILALIVVGILALIFLGTSVFIVDQTEQAVITRFGRFIGIREPGLHVKLPFGIDRNYTVNVRTVQTEEFGFRTTRSGSYPAYSNQASESVMLTGDLNIVDVEWIIQY
ncbi:SPFH domain-containing protein, partial [Treponema sp. R80B11-R83G3]